MDKFLPIIIPGAIGIMSAMLLVIINRYFDKRNKIFASKREQLEKIFAPLEVLTQINLDQFNVFQKAPSNQEHRDFIEQSIWYPNHIEIRKIITTHSHLLPEMPKVFLDLLEHINIWLFQYELKYTHKKYTGPVYAGTHGKPYPAGADAYITGKARELRSINKGRKRFNNEIILNKTNKPEAAENPNKE